VSISTPLSTDKESKLLLDEERKVGSVGWATYTRYSRNIDSNSLIILIFVFLVGSQVMTSGNSLFLGFWSGNQINGFSNGQYMAVYAGSFATTWFELSLMDLGLGAAIAVLTVNILWCGSTTLTQEKWAATYTMVVAGVRASYQMFNGAWDRVMRSPTSWHDRTPVSPHYQGTIFLLYSSDTCVDG
jgi:ATP-binding cassette subfamily C (CFTR/MRP) protein 1